MHLATDERTDRRTNERTDGQHRCIKASSLSLSGA